MYNVLLSIYIDYLSRRIFKVFLITCFSAISAANAQGTAYSSGHQTYEVIPEFWIVPRTGPEQPEQKPPAKLPQIDEESVDNQPNW